MRRSMAASRIAILSADAVLSTYLGLLLAWRGHRVCSQPADGELFDCVIADMDGSGLPLTVRWLAATFPHSACIVISGSPWSGSDTVAGLGQGYFLAKPFQTRQLVRLVEEIVDAR